MFCFFSTKRFLAFLLIFILMLSLSGISHAVALNLSTEIELKAAYLFNFLKFIEWDKDFDVMLNDGIYVTIVGDKDLFEAFTPVKEKKVRGRDLIITYTEKLDEVQPSHLIYIAPSVMKSYRTLPDYISQSGALTVGETAHFSKSGGVIGFIRSSDRIRFTINKKAADEAKLEISSKLLKLGLLIN